MRNKLALAAVLCLTCCNNYGPRVVDYPFIRSANTDSHDIQKIELTDTATFVTVHTVYYPNSWVFWNEETKIIADGRDYMIKGGIGMTPGEKLWMEANGEKTYTLIFEPIPFKTKTIDISEGGYLRRLYNFYGIDLTGKAKETEDRRLPAKAAPTEFPAFNDAVGETSFHFHFLNYMPGMDTCVTFTSLPVLGTREIESVAIKEDGTAEHSCVLAGTTFCVLSYGDSSCDFVIADPGESMDIYVDMNRFGKKIKRQRDGYRVPAVRYFATTGRFGPLLDTDFMRIYLKGFHPDLNVSSEEYLNLLTDSYNNELARIDSMDTAPVVRDIYKTMVKIHTLFYAVRCNYCLWYKARIQDWENPIDPDNFASLDKDTVESVIDMVKPLDTRIIFFLEQSKSHDIEIGLESLGLLEEFDSMNELHLAKSYLGKALSAELSAEDFEMIDQFKWKYLSNALHYYQDKATNPESGWQGPKKWLESILAPHAGKVVVVDFWNTWCGICRKISSQMEPKKSAELASDDIVWIYVADESSDKKEYDKLIKDMKGIHIYLTQSQREEVFNYFNLDGFPSFILAERDGSYEYRSDFIDVDVYEYELLKRINNK